MKVIHLVYNYTWRSHETGHLLQGIKSLASLGVPVYVTETGIPDRTGKKREEFFKTYPAQVLCISSSPLPSPRPLYAPHPLCLTSCCARAVSYHSAGSICFVARELCHEK